MPALRVDLRREKASVTDVFGKGKETMNILCCLLSDQHVPNLLSVHHCRPDRLVLVESEAMKKRDVAMHFLAALKRGGLDYDDRHDIEPLDAEDSLDAVRRTLRR